MGEKYLKINIMDEIFQNISELLLDIYLNTFDKDC